MSTELKKLVESINRSKNDLWVVSWWVDADEPNKARFHVETLENYMNASLRRLAGDVDPGYELIAILDSIESATELIDELTLRVS